MHANWFRNLPTRLGWLKTTTEFWISEAATHKMVQLWPTFCSAISIQCRLESRDSFFLPLLIRFVCLLFLHRPAEIAILTALVADRCLWKRIRVVFFVCVLWIDAFLAVIRRRSLDRPFLFRFPGPAGPPGRSIFSSLSQRLGPVSASCSRSTAHDWWHTMVLVESIPKQT